MSLISAVECNVDANSREAKILYVIVYICLRLRDCVPLSNEHVTKKLKTLCTNYQGQDKIAAGDLTTKLQNNVSGDFRFARTAEAKNTAGNSRAKTALLSTAKTAPSTGNTGSEKQEIGILEAIRPRKA